MRDLSQIPFCFRLQIAYFSAVWTKVAYVGTLDKKNPKIEFHGLVPQQLNLSLYAMQHLSKNSKMEFKWPTS